MDRADSEPSFVVGIGASAGGLEAVERMFDQMPATTGMAFVLVQHLSPDFKSLMDELLARWTDMPIHQAENGQRVCPDAIYLLPPGKKMVISEGALLVVDKEPDEGLSFPIDHFFRSLAQDFGQRAIAVVLSGTGSDGSRGIRDVREAGGLVIAQQEETAKFDGMPRSARNSGVVDLFLSPEHIPDALMKFNGRRAEVAFGEEEDTDDPSSSVRRIFTLLKQSYDIDFGYYKPTTVHRRIERRMMLGGVAGILSYVEQLEQDHHERELLYHDLLIGVTRFFRDQEAYDALVEDAITPLVAEASEGDELRIWVTACATGEEAYSIAMLLDEVIQRSGRSLTVKVFATDVNREALESASVGRFCEHELVGVSDERKSRYFIDRGDYFEVAPELRQTIVFAPHNLTKDPPFTRVNMITCRNLLIYMEPAVQHKLLSLFHFGLKTGGWLFLGSSEACAEGGGEFEPINRRWKIFQKSREGNIPDSIRSQFSAPTAQHPITTNPTGNVGLLSSYDALLEAVLPASFLVSEDATLLHTFGDAGRFLRQESGRQSSSLHDRILPELQIPVSAALRKAEKETGPVRFTGVDARDQSGEFQLSVQAINDRRTDSQLFLIQIEERDESSLNSIATMKDDLPSEQMTLLEQELRHTKQSLQATIEELESSNEELQATNEELVASNEELQSTNEELHSVNEELYTVNAEHQGKIRQLSELTRDMDNLLESTEVHTVFLDSNLAIRKFTPRIADKFHFLPQDVGRRICDFTHSIDCGDLEKKIGAVIASGASYQEEVRDQHGSWFLMRILPYRSTRTEVSARAPIDGVLLTLVEITKLREASQALHESVRQRDEFLAMLSHELRNPLGTILNATHLLSRKEIDSETTEALAVIQRQSNHMGTLLADLLDVTRVSQGKIQLQKRPFDLNNAIEASIETVRSRCDARGQYIVTETPSEPIWIFGSEPRIVQVISNLLTNAAKYSGHNEQIDLVVEPHEDNVSIHVRDRGVGIPPEQIDRVFEMFVQSDRTLDRADGGLGVGLTLVKSLVELHGGQVSVQSDGEGHGSVFSVTLPVCEAAKQPVAAKSDKLLATSQGQVVLIEDSIDASKMLAFLLEDVGYQVTVAHDGKRGLELIKELQPKTAVVDIGLPQISGYEVAKRVRAEPELEGTFLIALTGYGQANDRAEALAAGFDEHLVKPVDPDVLHQIIAEQANDLPNVKAS